MSLIRRKPQASPLLEEEEFITLKEASELLRLHESTIRKRRGGTQSFTHIPQGSPGSKRPRIMLLRSEVLEHRRKLIEDAKAKSKQHLELVWNTK